MEVASPLDGQSSRSLYATAEERVTSWKAIILHIFVFLLLLLLLLLAAATLTQEMQTPELGSEYRLSPSGAIWLYKSFSTLDGHFLLYEGEKWIKQENTG